MATLLSSLQKLFDKLERFEKLTSGQQAGVRAHLTRLESQAKEEGADADIMDALEVARSIVGDAAGPAYEKLTADDIVAEYHESYKGMSVRQRGAFKAKISRLLNSATEDGDAETVTKLEALQDTIQADADAAKRNRILAIAKRLKSDD